MKKTIIILLVVAILGGSFVTLFSALQSNQQPQEELSEEQMDPLFNTIEEDEEGNLIIQNPDDILVLVNKERQLPEDYKPGDLIRPDIPFVFGKEDVEKSYMRKVVQADLEDMFKASAKEGLDLQGVSAYRSYSRQEQVFNNKLKTSSEEEALKVVAKPGHSEHQTGLTIDVSSSEVGFELIEEFEDTKEGKWLAENAHKYGFIIRYPENKVSITGYSYEPWHLRYVTPDIATFLYDSGLTLEEVLGYEKDKE